MFTGTLTFDDASGDDQVFALVNQDGTGSRRLNIASTLSEPILMSIKHSSSGTGASAVDRHLVQFSNVQEATSGPKTAIVNFTISAPRDSSISSLMIEDLVANLIDFLTDGALATPMGTTALTQLLRGES
jgi:hypothetical protein